MNHEPRTPRLAAAMRGTALRRVMIAATALALLFSPGAPLVWAGPPFAEFVDPHPAVGNRFGETVVALSTGNVVITSPFDDAGGIDAGAVYLFNGATGALISTLRGSTAGDRIGSGGGNQGVVALANGNYVIKSPFWNGAAGSAGAATWGSGTIGVSGTVSASNSLVGFSASDGVGSRVTPLTNGNYVVSAPLWDNGGATNAGAVVWGNGATGKTGVVSASNSLVGTTASDAVGNTGVFALGNGNYVVASQNWDNGAVADAGAVTWANGATGITGAVSAANSLVGTTLNDNLAFGPGGVGVTVLSNGNYLVTSAIWDNGAVAQAGAVTWGNGMTGIVGAVSAANSLVGTTTEDRVGAVTALSNGNYVVATFAWDGTAANVGAVTWGNGATGISGPVSAANSLVGTTTNDFVGRGMTALTNGNYVVKSPDWDGAAVDVGAVTWGSGTAGIVGVVSASNSLVGTTASDAVGGALSSAAGGVTALTNGNYVVSSPTWNGTAARVGAVTWGNGTTGVVGAVSASNSLVGATLDDQVGDAGVTALSNGNYVVQSIAWDGAAANAGAATWGSGTTGVSGVVSASNSLVGSHVNDFVGRGGVTPLSNGNYVVNSWGWGGPAGNIGAVTWGNGATGTSGVVSVLNSLIGLAPGDTVGSNGVTALTNGNYVVHSADWHGPATSVGASTWGNGVGGTVGTVSASNSLVGSVSGDNVGLNGALALSNGNYVIGSRNWDNLGLADAGAVTWGNGTTGISGTVAVSNSIVGAAAGAGLTSGLVVADNANGTFLAQFLTEGGGRVRVGSQVDGVPPALSAGSDQALAEGNAGASNLTFTITLAAPSAQTVTVSAVTSDLTATAGSDYTATGPTTLTFAPGVTVQNFSVPILGDAVAEADETFQVVLSNATNGFILDGAAVGTITNDDGAPPSRVFVSSDGSDANACSAQTTPCRNIAAAISQVAFEGEVIILTPGEYEITPLVITRPVKVTSPSGTVAFVRQPITVNAPGARVVLRGLTIKGAGTGVGVNLTAADSLSIEECAIDRWSSGVNLGSGAATAVTVSNSVFTANTTGVQLAVGGMSRLALEGSRFEGNGTGLFLHSGAAFVRESAFLGHSAAGIAIDAGSVDIQRSEFSLNAVGVDTLTGGWVRMGRSRVFGNVTGLSVAAGGAVFESFGTNVIRGNGTNTSGTITITPEQ